MSERINQQCQRLLTMSLQGKLFVFGAGSTGVTLLAGAQKVLQQKIEMAAFLDNDSGKWGSTVEGHPVCSPGDVLEGMSPDGIKIVIASQYFKEISQQLSQYGLEEGVHYFNGFSLVVALERLEYNGGKSLARSSLSKAHFYEELRGAEGKACIFVLPVIPWDYRWQRPQQIFSRIGRENPVLYVDVDAKAQYSLVQGQRALDCVEFVKWQQGVYGVTLPSFEYVLHNEAFSRKTLENFTQAVVALWENMPAGITPVVVVQHPRWQPLLEELLQHAAVKWIYDCLDDFAAFGDAFGEHEGADAWLLANADAVVCTSQALYNRAVLNNQQVHLIRNGADYLHFSQGKPIWARGEREKPVIGYFGAIDWWLDMELIAEVTAQRPEWNFVFIGKVSAAVGTALKTRKNVCFLGEKPYEELPSYLASFDVCWIPFRIHALTEATNPVKVYEYLSAGKPVVATCLPEITSMSSLVYMADGAASCLECLEQALHEAGGEGLHCEERRQYARENSWDVRVGQWKHLLKQLLNF